MRRFLRPVRGPCAANFPPLYFFLLLLIIHVSTRWLFRDEGRFCARFSSLVTSGFLCRSRIRSMMRSTKVDRSDRGFADVLFNLPIFTLTFSLIHQRAQVHILAHSYARFRSVSRSNTRSFTCSFVSEGACVHCLFASVCVITYVRSRT